MNSTSHASQGSAPRLVTTEEAATWARYWTLWYERHMQEAAEAKRLAEKYGAQI